MRPIILAGWFRAEATRRISIRHCYRCCSADCGECHRKGAGHAEYNGVLRHADTAAPACSQAEEPRNVADAEDSGTCRCPRAIRRIVGGWIRSGSSDPVAEALYGGVCRFDEDAQFAIQRVGDLPRVVLISRGCIDIEQLDNREVDLLFDR